MSKVLFTKAKRSARQCSRLSKTTPHANNRRGRRRWPHTTVKRLVSLRVVRLPRQSGQLERETPAEVIEHRLWMLATFLADESTKTGLQAPDIAQRIGLTFNRNPADRKDRIS